MERILTDPGPAGRVRGERSRRRRSSPGIAPPSGPSRSTGRPRCRCAPTSRRSGREHRRTGRARPHTRGGTDEPVARGRDQTLRRTSASPTSPGRRSARVFHRRAARGEEALDAVPPRRRRACARRARVRRPAPRREPRAGLPLAARAQPEDVRGLVRRGPRRRHLPRRRLPLARSHRRRSTGARGGPELRRRVLQHHPRARLRQLHPQGVGVAHQPRRVHENLDAFRGWLQRGRPPGRPASGLTPGRTDGPATRPPSGHSYPEQDSAPPTYAMAGGASDRTNPAHQHGDRRDQVGGHVRLPAVIEESAKAYVENAIAVGNTPR